MKQHITLIRNMEKCNHARLAWCRSLSALAGAFVAIILGIATPQSANAQQEAQYSQYMFNGLFINPAYAGSREHASMSVIGRTQWTGFPGAPQSQAFTLHGPSASLKSGFGLVISNDAVGPIATTGLSAQYAYRIKFDATHTLALGLQGGLDYYRTDFAGLRIENPSDQSFNQPDVRRWLPNAGAGIYFTSKKAYIGASVPRLIRNRLSNLNTDTVARQFRHCFVTAGMVLNLSNTLKLRPSFLAKFSGAGGPQADLNLSLLIKDRIWIGASYRTEDALVFMAELWATPQLRIGYAYDATLSQLRKYSQGSHELMLAFDFAFKKGKVVSPRYF
jgi:type IX secretion system PorP/SprF family membrane protein